MVGYIWYDRLDPTEVSWQHNCDGDQGVHKAGVPQAIIIQNLSSFIRETNDEIGRPNVRPIYHGVAWHDMSYLDIPL